MKNKATILNVKKNEIIYVSKKRKVNTNVFSIVIIAIFLCGFGIFGKVGYIQNQILGLYNPVSSLYNDNSDLVFTFAGVSKENLNFFVPNKNAKFEIVDGDIVFEIVNSLMIVSCADGVVEEVGSTLDGIKYIKIKHMNSVYSIIENIDMVGVASGDIVKVGQDIATSKIGDKVTLKIFENNIQQKNIKIEHNKILWGN